ncbi:hypothetical protein [Streptomyces sp. NBC_01217]|uniref:hypothetical protein n=1 Tax=Streptomyces sp. NBC_01217 TaxID=2903779 RepID=UPI002E121ED2|nr:hypothetical protein OG507_20035 [Streptomyces sp. NBC_01217]
MNAALALAVGLIGAVLAWVALYVHWVVAAAVLVIFVILGVALFMHGKSTIRSAPQESVGWLEAGLALRYGAIASAGACVVVILGILLAERTDWSAQANAIIGAFSGALTTFIGALVVDKAKTADAVWMSAPIRKAFQETFGENTFEKGSDGEYALNNISGDWGRDDRSQRAEEIAAALKDQADSP